MKESLHALGKEKGKETQLGRKGSILHFASQKKEGGIREPQARGKGQ